MKVYYINTWNYQLTGHPDNFKINLYYFQERLSLQYNIILKSLSPFIYVSIEITNFQKDVYFLKSIPDDEDSYFSYHRSQCL